MTVRLYAMTCGWLTGQMSLFLAGEPGTIRVPVPVFLIDHPGGKVLFDSGLHPATGTDPVVRLGAQISGLFDVELGPDDHVAGGLGRCETAPGEIRYLVNSHLHFDHAGGNASIANADLVVQRREWQAAHDADEVAANFFDPKDYDIGHRVLQVDGEHDLFGDGRVVCLPTHGHTPGHQSLRVQLESGPIILAADACYLRRTLMELHLPSVVRDREGMLASLRMLRSLQDNGARILCGHDPEQWKDVPQLPQQLT